jgi:hypothetical protein
LGENKIKISQELINQLKVASSMASHLKEPMLKISKFQGQIIQMQDKFREPIVQALKFQQPILQVIKLQEPMMQAIKLQEQTRSLIEKVTRISNYINQNVLINLSKFKINYEKLSKGQKELAERMIRNGWYFSLELPLDAHKLLKLNYHDFNKVLTEFYEQYQEDMCDKIITQYPHRKKILVKAYQAHRKKDYELSIPVMFTQADGISEELFSEKLFSKNNKRLATEQQKQILFDENDFIDKCFCIQLATIGQLNENYNPTTYKECKKFNRHTVLHGKDINYAKKINSIKCLVMLNFLAEIKENYYEDKTKINFE